MRIFSRAAAVTTVVTVAVVAVAAAAAIARDRSADSVRHRPKGPIAVVLVQTDGGSDLVAVDLRRMTVIERVRLRSLSFELAAFSSGLGVVTAQCGGPDRSADRAVGIYEVGSGAVRYVELGVQNPLDVAVSEDTAMVLHGVEQDGRLLTTFVDLRKHAVVGRGTVSGTASSPRAFAPGFSVAEYEDADGPPLASRLVVLDARGRESSATTFPGRLCAQLSGFGEGHQAHLIVQDAASSADPARRSWRLLTVEVGSGKVTSTPLAGIDHGVADACGWGGHVALADADGLDMADPGENVRIYEPHTGRVHSVLRVPGGMPAALAAWNESLLVVDGVSGDLLAFGVNGQLNSRLELGGAPVGTAGIVVVP